MNTKRSSYISWAKQKKGVRHNLARSGVPAPPVAELTDDPAGLLEGGEHEDGWPPLQEAIGERYGVDAGRVVPAHGASMANHLAIAALLEPGDHVLVENPGYDPLAALPRYFQADVTYFSRPPENGFQPDPAHIGSLIENRTRLIILTDLHNPTGMRLDPEVLDDIVRLCEERQIYLLADEVYLEFLYDQGARTAAGDSGRVIATRSLTKAFGLDRFRLGWIIAPPALAESIRRLKDLYSITTAFPSERLGREVLGKADGLLEQTNRLLDGNRELVHRFIEGREELQWTPPPAGSVGFVDYLQGDVDGMASHAEKEFETLVAPGRFFGCEGWFRIGWGMPEDQLTEALERLGAALDSYGRKG